jgi:hypothetical protein
MLAASAVPNPMIIALVLAYLVCTAVVTVPYPKLHGQLGPVASR